MNINIKQNCTILGQYIDKHALSHSFISTAYGGVFIILSGLIIDPNPGRVITGLLLTGRGTISEYCRKFIAGKGYSEAASALPGMVIAALMNWPAALTGSTLYEAIGYGLPALGMTLKFLQYLPQTLTDLCAEKHALLKMAEIIEIANTKCLNMINKYMIVMTLTGLVFFLIDAYVRRDYMAGAAGMFFTYSGLMLGTKTWRELMSEKIKKS